MPAPLAKGIIIAASVLVAAGYAIYESPQFRQWIDQSRRKIAIALHQLGEDIQPRRQSQSGEDYDARRRELIRRERAELIRRAQEEGIAVDLDELARLGTEDAEMSERGGRNRSSSQRSFDDLVGTDGRLRDQDAADTAEMATGSMMLDGNVRRRGLAGFEAGSAAAAGDPFSDDARILFDRDTEARHSIDTIAPETTRPTTEQHLPTENFSSPVPSQLSTHELISMAKPQCPNGIDPEWFNALPSELQEEVVFAHNENAENQAAERASSQTLSAHPSSPPSEADAPADAQDAAAESFYSFTSSNEPLREPLDSTAFFQTAHFPSTQSYDENDDVYDDMAMSAGTLTPRSSGGSVRSMTTGASVVGSQADDVAVMDTDMSMQNDSDHDARSEAWSEGGFTDAESQAGDGIMTPSSWTDVGSDDEGSVSEWAVPHQTVHQTGNQGQQH